MKQGEIWLIDLDCFQIRSVSKNRLIKQIGKITFSEILKVQEGIIKIIGYDKY
jgi:mRNA-degrading endonuclease toxin of MazEF toxin-antitoxin module